MAYTPRHLTLVFTALLGLLCVARAVAQPAEEPPVLFRTIAIGSTVSGIFYEIAPGKLVAVSAGGSGLSQPYTSPRSGLISFFREVPSEEPGGKPRRVPVATARLGKGGPYLVVLESTADEAGRTVVNALAIDDSWDVHPLKTVRVFNFSRRAAAVNVEAETRELSTTQSHVFSYPAKKGAARFKVALKEESKWVLRVSCPQGVLPQARSTVLITDVAPTEENPNPVDVNVTNVFDMSKPAAPTPVGSVALNGNGR